MERFHIHVGRGSLNTYVILDTVHDLKVYLEAVRDMAQVIDQGPVWRGLSEFLNNESWKSLGRVDLGERELWVIIEKK